MTVVVIARDAARRAALVQEVESAGWTVRVDVPTEASLSPEDLGGVAALVVDANEVRREWSEGAEGTTDPLTEPLTAREREVLEHIAAGLSNKQIASVLDISEHTVKFHVSAVLGKLGVTSRAAAIRHGVRRGLVTI
jgi:DNA-binding CsgD family transcriptional regulator